MLLLVVLHVGRCNDRTTLPCISRACIGHPPTCPPTHRPTCPHTHTLAHLSTHQAYRELQQSQWLRVWARLWSSRDRRHACGRVLRCWWRQANRTGATDNSGTNSGTTGTGSNFTVVIVVAILVVDAETACACAFSRCVQNAPLTQPILARHQVTL